MRTDPQRTPLLSTLRWTTWNSSRATSGCSSETLPPPLLHLHTDHRLPTELCVESPPVLPLHRLRQVCWQHYSVQEWWGCYREEVLKMAACCSKNNFALHTKKTREIIIDLGSTALTQPPFTSTGSVWRGSTPSSSSPPTSPGQKTPHQSSRRLSSSYTSWESGSTTLTQTCCWPSTAHPLGACWHTASQYGKAAEPLQTGRSCRVVKMAHKIIGCPLPSPMDIYTSLSRANTIIRHQQIQNSFLLKALNSHMHWFLFSLIHSNTFTVQYLKSYMDNIYVQYIFILKHCVYTIFMAANLLRTVDFTSIFILHIFLYMLSFYISFILLFCTAIGNGFNLIQVYSYNVGILFYSITPLGRGK